MHPADEYAALKSEIRRLSARADALREGFLRPGAALKSNAVEVVIRHQTRRVFLQDRLPQAILSRPDLWETRSAPVVTLRDYRGEPTISRGRFTPKPLVLVAEEEPVLIEPFD